MDHAPLRNPQLYHLGRSLKLPATTGPSCATCVSQKRERPWRKNMSLFKWGTHGTSCFAGRADAIGGVRRPPVGRKPKR